MRVAVTGTPGTGKTTATERADLDLRVVHVNEVVHEEDLSLGTDPERDSVVADLDRLRERFEGEEDVLFESHLAHHLPADRVVVLRCHPEELERRLRERGWDDAKVAENVESERLDLLLSEAVERHGLDRVYEVDATDLSPSAVAGEIEAVVAGEREPGAGEVQFLDG